MNAKSKLITAGLIGWLSLALVGCSSMPSSGPSSRAISSIGANSADDLLTIQPVVLDVNSEVAQKMDLENRQALFTGLPSGGVNADLLGNGDTVEISIWEAPPAILFGGTLSAIGTGSGQSIQLPAQMIDQFGRINVPFVGQIKVSGLTARQVESLIVNRLSKMAHLPQVVVRQARNSAANVTIIREGSSVRMPLTSKGERILDAVAAIGGVASANRATIQLTRGTEVRSVSLMSIAQNPEQNIRLMPGDVITALSQPLSFVVMGATGRNDEVNFEPGLSLMQALGRVKGLNDSRADAQGVFVFRYENARTVNTLQSPDEARFNSSSPVPIVYRINLRDPNVLFYAQKFVMKDKDVLYVANAPAAELQKFLRIVFSITSPITGTVNSIENIAN